MLIKTLVVASLLTPVLAFSAAYAGPSNSIPTRTNMRTVDAKPYAQYVPATLPSPNSHMYRGGPKSSILPR